MRNKFKHLVFNLNNLDSQDLPIARAFLREMYSQFQERNVKETPILSLRLHDVLANYLLVRRLERASPCHEPSDCQTQPDRENVHPDVIGRARERLRKAMKELDEYFTQNGTPVPIGLADEVLPLLMKTRGVLEDALAHEAQIKRQEAESAPITS